MAKDDVDRDRAMRRYEELVEGYEDEDRGMSVPVFADYGYGGPTATAGARKTYPAAPPTVRRQPMSTDQLAARALERMAGDTASALGGPEAGRRARSAVSSAGPSARGGLSAQLDQVAREATPQGTPTASFPDAPPSRGRMADVPPEAAPALMAGDPSKNKPPTARYEDTTSIARELPAEAPSRISYTAPVQPVMMNPKNMPAPAFPGAPPAFPVQQFQAPAGDDVPGYMTPEEIAAAQEQERQRGNAISDAMGGFGRRVSDLNNEIARIRAGYDYQHPSY